MKKLFALMLLFSLLIPYNLTLAQEQQENLSVSESSDSQISQTEDTNPNTPSLPVLDDFLNQGAGDEPADLAGDSTGEEPDGDKTEETAKDAQTKIEEDAEDSSADSADTAETEPENPVPNPQSAPSDPWLNIAGLQELFSSDLFTGEARLNVPFSAPAGRNGLTPESSLNYSSFKNDLLSPYGYGFDFSNSSIFRTARHGVDQIYNRSDFAVKLGGKYNELVLIDANLGLYQGKLGNDGNKYFLQGSGTDAKWLVLDSQGVQYYFGQSASSRQFDPNDQSRIFQWMLDKTIDLYGNKITYAYFSDHNQIYPDAIQYGYTSETDSLYRVKFDYSQKSTSASSYQTQFEVETYYLLSSIKVQRFIESDWQTQKEYALTYDYLDQAISRLLSIAPKAGAQTLPALNFIYYSGGPAINLLKTINNSKAGIINLEYLPSTQYVDPETGLRSQLPFIIDTLHKTTRLDQITGLSSTQTFDYFGGHYFVDYQDIFAREYAGFHKVFSTDSLGQITKTYFHQSEFAKDNPDSALKGEYEDHISKKGRTYRQEVYDSSGRLFQSTITKWDKRDLPGENRWLVWPSQTVNFTWDGDSSHKDKAEAFQYDDFGNVLEQIEFGEVQANSDTGSFADLLTDKRTTQFAYALNEPANIVSLPSSKIIKDYNNEQVQFLRYYYDDQLLNQATKGSLTLQEHWLDADGSYVQTNYEYNQYGLLIKQTDPLNNSTIFQYDSFNLYPIVQINALGHQFQYAYDYSLGLLKRTTDPNNIVSENIYDGFGRLTKVLISDQNQSSTLITKQEISYNDFVQPVLVLKKDYLSEQANPKEIYQYFDGFGRIIKTKASSDQIGQFNGINIVYDELGRVKKEYLPEQTASSNYQATAQPDAQAKIYSYDAVSRPIKIQTAVGSETYNYLDWQVQTIDPNNHQTDKIYDGFGRLIKVNEHNGQNIYSTEHQYDVLGNLIKIIDAEGNEREFAYDSLNRQIQNQLPHKPGTIASAYFYEYDKNGNKISQTDPNNQTVNYAYDQLNRILTKDDSKTPETEIIYLYDQSQFGIGKLSKVQTSEYGIEYQYDKQGNVKEEIRSIIKSRAKDQVLTGWAWSDKIGWISFNCKDRELETQKTCKDGNDQSFNLSQNLIDYSVNIDGVAGIISGYAWNEHLGWISFNRQDTGTPPDLPYNDSQTSFIAKAELDPAKQTTDLTGWARIPVFGGASIPSTNSPDFDGWIKLAGAAQDGSTYAVKINKQTSELTGWAWSNAGIGWISFNCLNTNACGASDYKVKSVVLESIPPEDESNLASYWSFDEGAGLTAIDGSKNGNDGTLNNFSLSEKITNGTFAANITGWTDNSTLPDIIEWSASYGGSMKMTGATAYAKADQSIATSIGVEYTVSVEVKAIVGGGGECYIGTTLGGYDLSNLLISSVGTYNFTFVATTTTTYIRITTGWNNFYIDNVSVKQEAWVAAVSGTGLDFDGTDDYVDAGSNASLDIEGAGTVAFWIKPDSAFIDAMNKPILVRDGGGSWTNAGVLLYKNTNDKFAISIGNGTTSNSAVGTTVLIADTWYYVAGTFNGSNLKLYVNGVKEGESSQTITPEMTGQPLYFGKWQGFTGAFLDGLLDEVRIYSTALTAKEIQELYQKPGMPQEPLTEFQTYSTKYSFDNCGALQKIAYPDNSCVEYSHNQTGKINQVKKDGQALVANISYSPVESIAQIDYANGVKSIYSYDQNELYRLKNKQTTESLNILQNINYSYDPVGNITRIQDIGTQTPKDANYVYDDLNRLTQARIIAGATITENFAYSAIGNILNKTGVGDYGYADPRHPSAATKAGGNAFTYDKNGSLVSSLRANGESISYQYDYANRLVEVANGAGTSKYIYGDGYERIQKQLADGKFTTYIGEIAEMNELGEFTDYYFADKLRIATVDPTGLYYNTNDHLSSASLVTNASGGVVQKLDYYPFGAERLNEKSDDFETHFTFTDQEKDSESGLLYYGARYYDPVIGRFLSADPVVVDNVGRKEFAMALQNPQMLNGYSYVGNNSLKYVDSEGEFAGLVVAVGIAVLSGAFLQNILPAQAPEAPACFSAQPKTFGELAVPQFDALPGYQKEAIRWAPLLLGGLKSVGKEGLEAGIEKFSQQSITSNETTKFLGTRRDNLLQGVEDGKLKNIIENFYRELKPGTKVIGDGGAIDAFRYTARTGELVGGTNHAIKLNERLNGLNNLLKNNLSSGDRQKAEWLANNIKDALKGGGKK